MSINIKHTTVIPGSKLATRSVCHRWLHYSHELDVPVPGRMKEFAFFFYCTNGAFATRHTCVLNKHHICDITWIHSIFFITSGTMCWLIPITGVGDVSRWFVALKSLDKLHSSLTVKTQANQARLNDLALLYTTQLMVYWGWALISRRMNMLVKMSMWVYCSGKKLLAPNSWCAQFRKPYFGFPTALTSCLMCSNLSVGCIHAAASKLIEGFRCLWCYLCYNGFLIRSAEQLKSPSLQLNAIFQYVHVITNLSLLW